jgi:uncharacterized protein YbaR (Trm112 family)
MPLDSILIEILVDPVDHGPLWYYEARSLLYNPRSAIAYAVVDSIPVILAGDGRSVDAEEAAALDAERTGATQTGVGRS